MTQRRDVRVPRAFTAPRFLTGLLTTGLLATGLVMTCLLMIGGLARPALASPALAEQDGAAPAPMPPATALSVDDFAWLAGHWRGEREGELIEESWLPPAHGVMLGMFRWVSAEGELRVYELMTLEPEDGAPVLKLRHFNAGLVAWEDKDGALTFHLAPGSTASRPTFVGEEEGQKLRLTLESPTPDTYTAKLEILSGAEPQVLDFLYRRGR